MNEGIRYGFKVGDRWPFCSSCGSLGTRAFRKVSGRWRDREGEPLPAPFPCACGGEIKLVHVLYADDAPRIPWTIRWHGNRYIVVRANESGPDVKRLFVFGSEVGGKTKEEALFWTERTASKNGLAVVLPESFEGVEAMLPEEKS